MSSQGYDSSKGSDGFFFLMLLAIVGLYFFFSNNFQIFAGAWKYVRIAEMGLFYWVPDWMPFYGRLEVKGGIDFLLRTPAVDIMPRTVLDFDRHYLHWFTWIPGMTMIYWGVKRILSTGGVSTRYNMEGLLKRVAPLYPHLSEFVNSNPEKEPIIYKRNQKDTHKWAMSMSPRDFSLMVPPMGLERQARKQKSLKAPIWDGGEGFDMDLAERSFKTQLGERFSGINHLKTHEKTIFDELVKQLAVDQEVRFEYFDGLARNILRVKGAPKINKARFGQGMTELYSFIEAMIEEKKSNSKIKFDPRSFLTEESIAKTIRDNLAKFESKDPSYMQMQSIFRLILAEQTMGQHAFVRTGLMQLLDKARDSGVFATDNIKWVKKVDRPLWYCLSSVGRNVSFVESAGCFAHWLIEKQVGRPISHPEVSEAVQGLFKALQLDKTEE